MPHLMNCAHMADGWCLDCVGQLHDYADALNARCVADTPDAERWRMSSGDCPHAMNDEVMEALRSAHELCAYLWNNTDANDPEAGNVELVAHSDRHAEQLAALLNDARTRVDAALHGLEIQHAGIGNTADKPHGPVSEQMMRRFYGPPK